MSLAVWKAQCKRSLIILVTMIERSLILDSIVLEVCICSSMLVSDLGVTELLVLVMRRVFSLFIHYDDQQTNKL